MPRGREEARLTAGARLRRLGGRIPAPGWMMLALLAGFAMGLAAGPGAGIAIRIARFLGNLWIDALKMTILPLIVALVVTSMASLARGGLAGSEAGSTIGRRLPALFVLLPLAGILIAITLGPMLLALHPLSPDVAAGLRAGFAPTPVPPSPAWDETIRGFVPVNVFASAAAGAMVPLVLFAAVLGLALGRIDPTRAASTLAPFAGLADAMIVIVGWVLRVAALGIFALAFSIGATAGLGALAALAHYIFVQAAVALALIVLLYVVAVTLGRVPLLRFARAMAPAQAVAAGTQSSVASLPAMLASAEGIGVAASDAGVVIPLAVAVFKVSAGSGTIITSLGAAWMAGVPIEPAQLIAAIPIALLATFTVLGVPGPGSVLAATTPVAMVLGAPVELLVVTLAVDTIPDMFRTTANVTADVAVAAIAAPRGVSEPGTPAFSDPGS